MLKESEEGGAVSTPLILALRRQRKADLWELEVSQGYIMILDTLSQKRKKKLGQLIVHCVFGMLSFPSDD